MNLEGDTQMKLSRKTLSLVALTLLTLGMTASVSAAHTATTTVAPTEIDGGSTDNYAFTVTNDGGSSDNVYKITIEAPTGFSVDTGTIQCPTGWSVGSATDSSTVVCITDTFGQNVIVPGGSRDISFDATSSNPSSDATKTWSVTTRDDNGGATDTSTANTLVDVEEPSSDTVITPSTSVTKQTPWSLEAQNVNDAGSGVASVTLEVQKPGSSSWTDVETVENPTATTSFSDYTPSSGDGEYQFRTVATDNVGNTESVSGSEASLTYDTKAPTVSIDSPTGSSVAYLNSADTLTVDYSYTEQNPQDLKVTVESNTETTTPVSAGSYDFTGLPSTDGTNDLTLEMTDAASQTGTATQTGAVVVDDTAPGSVSNLAHTDDANSGYDDDTNIKFTWDAATDGTSGVDHYRVQYSADGGSTYSETTVEAGTTSYTVSASDGDTVDVKVSAVDKAGNEGTVIGSNTVTVDTSDPSVTGTTVTPNPVTDSDTGSEVSVEVRFNEEMDTSVTPTVDITGLSSNYNGITGSWNSAGDTWTGTFTINDDDEDTTANVEVASAKDLAGNQMAKDTSNTFEVDTNEPSPPASVDATAKAGGDIEVTFDDASASDVSSYEIYRAPSTGGSFQSIATVTDDSTSYSYTDAGSGLTDGEDYFYKVSSVDDVDNEGSTSTEASAVSDGTSPTVSSVTLTNDGNNNLDLNFQTDEQLGSDALDLSVEVSGPSSSPAFTFDGSDFTESSVNSGYEYALSTAQAFSDGEGDYTAEVVDAKDQAGNNGGTAGDGSSLTDSHNFVPAKFSSAEAEAGTNTVELTFSEPVYTESDSTGALSASDLQYNSNSGETNSVSSVEHAGGEKTATLTLSSTVSQADLGTATISAAANQIYDSDGNAVQSSEATLEDTLSPSVASASITGTPITDSDTGTTQTVTVNFDEEMDTSVSPTVEITGLATNPPVSGSYDGSTTWTGTVTFPDSDEEVEGTFSVTGAQDKGGNFVTDYSQTFDVDTENPVVTVDTPVEGSIVSDSISLSSSETTGDIIDSTTWEYSTDGSSWTEIRQSDGSWDTTIAFSGAETQVTIRNTKTDDNGNQGADSVTVEVDNKAPAIGTLESSINDGQAEVTNGDKVAYTVDMSAESDSLNSVELDCSSIGDSGSVNMVDDGTGADSKSGDGVYAAECTVGANGDLNLQSEESRTVDVTATDDAVNANTATGASVTVDTVSPTVIADIPTYLTGTEDVTSIFTPGEDTESTVYEYNSGNGWTEISSPSNFDTTNLADGSVDLRATVTDDAGNQDSVSGTTTVDNTAPETTDDAPSGWQSSQVTVGLTPSDDTSGVSTTYYCANQDSSTACSPTTEGTSLTLSADGEHYIRYYSVDNAGNEEPVKEAVVKIDQESPIVTDVSLVDSEDGDRIVRDGDTLKIEAKATDGVSQVSSVTVDAGAFGGPSDLTLTSGSGDLYTATFQVDGSSTTDGGHTLSPTAEDQSGNTANVESGSVELDTVKSTITGASIDSKNSQITVSFSENVDANDGAVTGSDFHLESELTGLTVESVTDNTDTNNQAVLDISFDGSASGTESITVSPADGSSIFDVADNAMEVTQSASVGLNDRQAPEITGLQPSDGSTVRTAVGSSSVTVSADITDENTVSAVTFTATSKSGDKTCTTPAVEGDTYTCTFDLPNEVAHDVTVEVEDDSGNKDSSVHTFDLEKKHTVSLNSGTNMISVPLSMSSNDPETLFGSNDKIEEVWSYNEESGEWNTWYQDNPEQSTLTSVTHGEGYWVETSGATSVTFTGERAWATQDPTQPLSYTLYGRDSVSQGWNLIGFTDQTTGTAYGDYLTTGARTPLTYDSASSSFVEKSTLNWGTGYWVYLDQQDDGDYGPYMNN